MRNGGIVGAARRKKVRTRGLVQLVGINYSAVIRLSFVGTAREPEVLYVRSQWHPPAASVAFVGFLAGRSCDICVSATVYLYILGATTQGKFRIRNAIAALPTRRSVRPPVLHSNCRCDVADLVRKCSTQVRHLSYSPARGPAGSLLRRARRELLGRRVGKNKGPALARKSFEMILVAGRGFEPLTFGL